MDLCGLRVKLSPAHLSTTHGESFTLSLLMLSLVVAESQAGKFEPTGSQTQV